MFLLRFGNLSRNVTDEILKEIGTNYGEVKRVISINFPQTKKPKGVSYLEYSTEEAARNAFECLNPSELQLE